MLNLAHTTHGIMLNPYYKCTCDSVFRSDLIPGSQTDSEPKIEIQSVIIHKSHMMYSKTLLLQTKSIRLQRLHTLYLPTSSPLLFHTHTKVSLYILTTLVPM